MRELIEKKIAEDFDKFDFEDKLMQKYCEYHRTKHIQISTQIVLNCIAWGDYVSTIDIDDLIHGLNHVFFNGVAAERCFEWKKEREKCKY